LLRESFDYVDYLEMKRSVDDDSLNKEVWDAMATWMNSQQKNRASLRILEIGAGIGTMIERLLDHELLCLCEYTAVELESGFRDVAMQRLRHWAHDHACDFQQINSSTWLLSGKQSKITVHWIQGDALQIANQTLPDSFDLIIGHAVIDLLPVPACMPDLLARLTREGACYFSLNYAGETLFLPAVPGDIQIFEAYNNDMDKRFPTLDWQPSQTGNMLGPWLEKQGHCVLAEGASNWELQAKPALTTNLFIANILDTIETALATLPGLTEWLTIRRQQLQDSQLTFRASNRDCFSLITKD